MSALSSAGAGESTATSLAEEESSDLREGSSPPLSAAPAGTRTSAVYHTLPQTNPVAASTIKCTTKGCGRHFVSDKEREQHHRITHSGVRRALKITYTDISGAEHIHRIHRVNGTVSCVYCRESYSHDSALRKHAESCMIKTARAAADAIVARGADVRVDESVDDEVSTDDGIVVTEAPVLNGSAAGVNMPPRRGDTALWFSGLPSALEMRKLPAFKGVPEHSGGALESRNERSLQLCIFFSEDLQCMVCIACGSAISKGARTALSAHLARKSHLRQWNQLRRQVGDVVATKFIPLNVRLAVEEEWDERLSAVVVADPITRPPTEGFPWLPVVQGLECVLCSAGATLPSSTPSPYCCPLKDTMEKHFNRCHPGQPRLPNARKVLMQTLYRGTKVKYYPVNPPSSRAAVGDDVDGDLAMTILASSVFAMTLSESVGRSGHDADENATGAFLGTSPFYNGSIGFVLRAFRKSELRSAVNTTVIGSGADPYPTLETHMTSLLRLANDSIAGASSALRELLQVGKARDDADEKELAPARGSFQQLQRDETICAYSRFAARLIRFVLKVTNDGADGDATRALVIKNHTLRATLSPPTAPTAPSSIYAASRRLHGALSVDEGRNADAVHRELLDVIKIIIFTSHPASARVDSYLAVIFLSLTHIQRKGNRLEKAPTVTNRCAMLEYVFKAVALCCISGDIGDASTRLDDCLPFLLMRGVPNPASLKMVVDIHIHAEGFGSTGLPKLTVGVDPVTRMLDREMVSIQDKTITLSAIRRGVGQRIIDARNLLQALIGDYGHLPQFRDQVGAVSDDLQGDKFGYGFHKDDRNGFAECQRAFICHFLKHHLRNRDLPRDLNHLTSDNVIVNKVLAWRTTAEKLKRIIYFLIHVLAPCARATEWIECLLINGATDDRNVYYLHKSIMFLLRYNKSSSYTSKSYCIPRFSTSEVTALLLPYIVLVLPVMTWIGHFNSEKDPKARLTYLFVDEYGNQMPATKYRSEFEHSCTEAFGVRLTVLQWRHVAKYFHKGSFSFFMDLKHSNIAL
jgi:hypothetical protein